MIRMRESRIRTLLIDDSSFMRKIIGDIISSDENIELIGSASNGRDGCQLISELRPDVVVTDMIMPEYDGLYVVRNVMEHYPTPVILLSSLYKGNHRIFEALEGGAFEFIDKPTELGSMSIRDYPLLNLIKHAAAADITLLKAKQVSQEQTRILTLTLTEKGDHEIIVIGASTGGPGAVESIVMSLPKNLSIPVVIAQHMPARFLETFAQRLSSQSPLPVKMAFKGQPLTGGIIYIASGEANTRIERSTIDGHPFFVFTERVYDEFNSPSINCLFESAASVYGPNAMGIILTGMGKDGMRGLKNIYDAGGFTIAQNEDSCVVYGMPKAAFECGAVRQVVPLRDIPNCIIKNL
jgi:two-component system chemotaxis response regulator CheB